MATYSNYPQSARKAARRALRHKEKNGTSCGTSVGWVRASQLSSGAPLSLSTVKRTFSFLSRAAVYNQGKFTDEKGRDICGSIMYAAWGGSSMRSWCSGVIRKAERQAEVATEERAITDAVKKGLQKKVKDHNDKDPKHKATYGMLAACFRRGIGAYKTNPQSVRPNVKSPEQWAFARVNAFMYALRNERFKGGKFDLDLLPSSHPLSTKRNAMSDIERRHLANNEELEVRLSDEGRTVEGYAAVFDQPTMIGQVEEVVSKGAFEDRLGDDVVALFNHDQNMPLARSVNGEGTLRLKVDEKGLYYRFELGNQSYAQDLAESIKRGDVRGSSFGFVVREDDYEKKEDGTYRRYIKKVSRLADISPVVSPAYPQTSVKMRDMIAAMEAESEVQASDDNENPPMLAPKRKVAEALLSIHHHNSQTK
jgi:HK97 family phage prohead protease